jgi:hypothetical protein
LNGCGERRGAQQDRAPKAAQGKKRLILEARFGLCGRVLKSDPLRSRYRQRPLL